MGARVAITISAFSYDVQSTSADKLSAKSWLQILRPLHRLVLSEIMTAEARLAIERSKRSLPTLLLRPQAAASMLLRPKIKTTRQSNALELTKP
jgi:hypothetical protein